MRLSGCSVLFLLVVLLACCALPSSCAPFSSRSCAQVLPKCNGGSGCPDLVVDGARVQNTAHVDTVTMTAGSCAVVEGCTSAGTRRLLRFDVAVQNRGTADLHLGSPTGKYRSCFEYSSCHAHYHFDGFAQYTLLYPDGRTVVATGAKAASCLLDSAPIDGFTAPTPAQFYTCANQGIHVGYQDVYRSSLDCQWIDVTGVAAGDYLLRVEVNPLRLLAEGNYANNAVTVLVSIGATAQAAVAATAPTMQDAAQHVLESAPAPARTQSSAADSSAAAGHGRPEPPMPTDDPAECPSLGGCESCTSNGACGWCATGPVYCAAGNAEGPTGGHCLADDWKFDEGKGRATCSSNPPRPTPPNRGRV